MSIPTQPTSTTIVSEAWKLLGKSSPTTTEITRAIDYGLEMVKWDVMAMGREWDFLRFVSYQPTTAYKSRYQLPTDFSKLLDVTLYDGTRRGTAQAGASTTITLASSDTGGSVDTQGKMICITGGTGSGQALQCYSYNSSTKVATMEEAWSTTPDNTSTYLVVDKQVKLKDYPIDDYDKISNPATAGTASKVFIQGDSAEGDLLLNRAPDAVYVLAIRYYVDLLKVDLTSTLYSRILRLLNGVFIQGVFVWSLQDDSRSTVQKQIYNTMLQQTGARYLYPNNLSNVSCVLDWE